MTTTYITSSAYVRTKTIEDKQKSSDLERFNVFQCFSNNSTYSLSAAACVQKMQSQVNHLQITFVVHKKFFFSVHTDNHKKRLFHSAKISNMTLRYLCTTREDVGAPLSPYHFQCLSFLNLSPLKNARAFRINQTSLGKEKTCALRTKMVFDPASVGTGYAFLNSFKGVVIGPSVNEVMSAICGGTVGVMGTIIALEVRRQRVKERKQCPYCRGTGKLPCATCYSLGTVPSVCASSGQEPCSPCSSSGYLQCNHVSLSSSTRLFQLYFDLL